MSDPRHAVVITETGEMVPADDPALALELGDEEERVGRGAAGDAPASAAGQEPTTPAPPPRPAELVMYERPLDPQHLTFSELGKLSRIFAASGFFADVGEAAQAVVKMMAGQELGLGPFQSMSGFHIVEGKPVMSAGLVGALVKRSGRYDYRVLRAEDDVCELEWYQDDQIVGTSSFTEADRERAGLRLEGRRGKSGWGKYPADMMFARALTRGARRFCPDIFGGAVYAESELDG